jgi:cytochrome bd-type quinol oxidase subunit 1
MDFLDPLLLARWQFGLTTLYHFIFVPLTLGMSLFVAIFQTVWHRTGDVKWLHLTRFFGKIFLINFAMGIVTGIVQEFQFGMNWSSYSRFVGDVFGAPLAFEGLMAFFFEATFIGLWIFGWNKLPAASTCHHLDDGRRHLAVGVLHPRGQRVHAEPEGLPDVRRRTPRRDGRLLAGADQPVA